tara:strand:- start:764 stop:1285 length:522 start_codon:yes stop_codon:yes gene_type:complete
MERRVTLGRVAGVFGVRGWVKLRSYTRPIENLLDYESCWIVTKQGSEFASRLLEAKMQSSIPVCRLLGSDGQVIEDRDVAASLIGSEVQVNRSQMPETEEGEHYWIDLVGLEVRNKESVVLGSVDSLTSNGAQDILVVKQGKTQRLIPFVMGPIIESVDIEKGVIVADWQPDY